MMASTHSDAIIVQLNMARRDFNLQVDLQLPSKGISVLYGPSGCGKTTIIRCLAGLEKADSGTVKIGQDVWQDSGRSIFLPSYKRAIGYVFQEASLLPHLNVKKNLEYGLKRTQKRGQEALNTAIELLDIAALLPRHPATLSGGERQRVAIARALALDPKILLMDEPLASLDGPRKQELLPYFKTLQKSLNIPLMYVTHSTQEMTQLADHLVLLERGSVKACGPLNEVLAQSGSPTAQGEQASSIIQATLSQQEPEHYLSQVRFTGGVLNIPYSPQLELQEALRLRIFARDVSISTERPKHSSILNILPATIVTIQDHQQGQTLLQLDLQGTPLLARITQKSVNALSLHQGMSVFAQIKATSLLH